MGYQKIKAFGCIVFEIIDRLAGSECSWDPNSLSHGLELMKIKEMLAIKSRKKLYAILSQG